MGSTWDTGWSGVRIPPGPPLFSYKPFLVLKKFYEKHQYNRYIKSKINNFTIIYTRIGFVEVP